MCHCPPFFSSVFLSSLEEKGKQKRRDQQTRPEKQARPKPAQDKTPGKTISKQNKTGNISSLCPYFLSNCAIHFSSFQRHGYGLIQDVSNPFSCAQNKLIWVGLFLRRRIRCSFFHLHTFATSQLPCHLTLAPG
jgi:hypothetical protein